jgi:NHLM bacteriocin system ABC transporter peptidase/ATP-binding protein
MNTAFTQGRTSCNPSQRSPVKLRARTPTVPQMEAVECGAAALGSVLGYHGRHVPLEQLRTICGVSRDGSKASNIVRGARHFGLIAKGYKQEIEDLRRLPLPLLVFWNFNHFVVVEGFDTKKVYINDPATGPRTVSAEEFDEAFTGIALTFVKGPEFRKGGRRKTILASLRRRLPGSGLAVVQLILVTLAMVVPSLCVPAFSRIFVDAFLMRGRVEWVVPLVAAMVATALMRACLTGLQQNTLLRFETKLAVNSSAKFFWHLIHLPMEFFAQRFTGELGSRVETNDRVASLLSRDIATNFVNLLLLIFYVALMIQYDVLLTLVGVLMAMLNLFMLRYISRKQRDEYRKILQEKGKLVGTSTSGIQMIETLKAASAESHFFSRWAGYQAKVINVEQGIRARSLALGVLPAFLSMLTAIAVLSVGGYHVMQGALTLGGLLALQVLLNGFADPVSRLVELGGKLQQSEGDLARLDDVLEYELDPHSQSISDARVTSNTDALQGYLEFRNVTFGYSRVEKPIITDLSLSLRPGTKVAIVGDSGSGKSTIAKLACGLYEPWSGEILHDGRPRNSLPRALIWNSIAFVDQDIVLFEGTVRDNLSLWDVTVKDAALAAAARDSCIHADIISRSGGYGSLVQEGARDFSGGQRQRLEIARALSNNPRILVLDEATSALDPLVEKEIYQNLCRRGCACLILAHRLSTIRDCDEILVLQRGQTVQRGTHEALSIVPGVYRNLIRTA